ncbi:ketoacyl-ACP synthase III family protein [Kitasatospora sp. NPDC057541]|uniref:ketoacyl-ACP synthase III family protein n=1 Tax=Kitasatospora sp. NPDC057541 TaxID=3346161 RepID=UPI0036C171E5
MRLATELGIAAVEAYFPPARESARQALAQGRLDPDDVEDLGYREVPVATAEAPPEMALRAARTVLADAGWPGDGLGLIAHSWMYHQGHDVWSAPHYLASALGAERAQPIGVQQVCNGAVAALEVAATRIAADPAVDRALVTTADRFTPPAFDRWNADYSLVYGDSATAALVGPLDEGRDLFRLRALVTHSAPRLELLHRGELPFGPAPLWPDQRVDIRRAKKSYLSRHGLDAFTTTTREMVRAVVRDCLADAGLTADADRPAHVVLPRLGAKTLRQAWVPAIAEVTSAPTLSVGHRTGHLGPGDALAGIADLVDRLAPGESGLVLNAGAGFAYSGVLVTRLTARRTRPAAPTPADEAKEETR